MISVVMPVLNEERLVGRALRSILEQTFPDFEMIVVDNGSTDGTREVVSGIAARDPRVRLVDEPTPGTHAARNRGLAEARRPWVAVQDADDVSHPERLACLLEHVRRRPRTVVVGSWAVCYSEQTGLREPLCHATGDYAVRCQLRTGPSPFVHSSVLLKREACVAVGGYPEGFQTADDYALWGVLQHAGRLENVPRHLVLYRHQDREPDSAYRGLERRVTAELMRRFFRPATRWDEWVGRLSYASRRRRGIERIPLDWPQALLRSYGLDEVLDRKPAATSGVA